MKFNILHPKTDGRGGSGAIGGVGKIGDRGRSATFDTKLLSGKRELQLNKGYFARRQTGEGTGR